VQIAAVVDARGVTEAAALLGLSQPAISRTIAFLEKRIGAPLFQKGRRPLIPTPLGTTLAEHGAVIRDAARRASDAVRGYRTGDAGLVRIGGVPFFMDAVVSQIIAEFQNRFPEIKIIQSYGYFAQLTSDIRAHRIDLAISPVDVLNESAGLTFHKILPARNVVGCSMTHPLLLLKRKLRMRELLNYAWIAPPRDSPLDSDLHRLLESLGTSEVMIRYSGGSLASVVNYLRASDCLAVMPHSVIFALRNDRNITALPIKIDNLNRSLGLLSLSDVPQSFAVTKLAEYIRASFQKLNLSINRHEQSLKL
jgi:DNA-binding transcriptional LysR family regulator